MKLTTIFRHYSKFQSQWKVNYFEQHCDWEQLPNWKQSSDFKAAKQQEKTQTTGFFPKQLERPSVCCSRQFCKTTPTPRANVEQLPNRSLCTCSTTQQHPRGPGPLSNSCCSSAGMLLPTRAAGEHPKGEWDPTVHWYKPGQLHPQHVGMLVLHRRCPSWGTQGARLPGASCRECCCQKLSSCKQCWRKRWLPYSPHYHTYQIKTAESHLTGNQQCIPAAQLSLPCRNLHLLSPNALIKWFDHSKPAKRAGNPLDRKSVV